MNLAPALCALLSIAQTDPGSVSSEESPAAALPDTAAAPPEASPPAPAPAPEPVPLAIARPSLSSVIAAMAVYPAMLAAVGCCGLFPLWLTTCGAFGALAAGGVAGACAAHALVKRLAGWDGPLWLMILVGAVVPIVVWTATVVPAFFLWFGIGAMYFERTATGFHISGDTISAAVRHPATWAMAGLGCWAIVAHLGAAAVLGGASMAVLLAVGGQPDETN